MKVFIVILFAFTSAFASPSQSEVRSIFHKAATEERSCRQLIKILNNYNETNNPIYAGYKACATMMMAKYVFNPYSKLSYFFKGRALLEKCIANEKQNVELRFLRFTVQSKAPFFLNYRSSIKEDKAIIKNSLAAMQDIELKKLIIQFINSEKV